MLQRFDRIRGQQQRLGILFNRLGKPFHLFVTRRQILSEVGVIRLQRDRLLEVGAREIKLVHAVVRDATVVVDERVLGFDAGGLGVVLNGLFKITL